MGILYTGTAIEHLPWVMCHPRRGKSP